MTDRILCEIDYHGALVTVQVTAVDTRFGTRMAQVESLNGAALFDHWTSGGWCAASYDYRRVDCLVDVRRVNGAGEWPVAELVTPVGLLALQEVG
jgi:hypothetical protein